MNSFSGLISTCLLVTLFFSSEVDAQSPSFDDSEYGIQLRIVNENEKEMACRIHLKKAGGESVVPPNFPVWDDHFVCDGIAELNLPPGEYHWLVERGPEYERKSGRTKLDRQNKRHFEMIVLKRICNLRREGWVSADLHVHRKFEEIELLTKAEDLDYAPIINWWNQPGKQQPDLTRISFAFDRHRMIEINVGEDEREGGALLYFGLKRPLDLSVYSREFPSPMKFVNQARIQNEYVWIDIEKPFWWDVPAWLATGKMNSIGLANNHMLRNGMLENEAWGKTRNRKTFPAPHGNGYWSQEIYYQIMNCGIRIPPSAGSASGVLKNPVGYNRVYIYDSKRRIGEKDSGQQEKFSREQFWSALGKGQSFVTNGPLLRVFANGRPPGAEFDLNSDNKIELDLSVELDSNDVVPALEVIFNGRIYHTILCDAHKPGGRRLKQSQQQSESFKLKLEFDRPGWFLVRAITEKRNTFRFASTAPFFVGQQMIDRDSAQFFLNWTEERIGRIKTSVRNPDHQKAILDWHEKARAFWQKKVETATTAPVETFVEFKAGTIAAISRSIDQFGTDNIHSAIAKANSAKTTSQFTESLVGLTLATVSINPESRVKIASTRDRIKILPDKPTRFLVCVDNVAGITAPLRLRTIDLAKPKSDEADWCDVKLVEDPYTSSVLTGNPSEFKLIEINVSRRGLNEVRIVADAGQGTQDLGFRATMDLLIDSR